MTESEIICPFFRKSKTKQKISCEVPNNNMIGLTVTFPTWEALEEYVQTYCNTHSYGECVLAKMIQKKYEGE